MSISSARHYDSLAAGHGPRYAAAPFEDVHGPLLPYLPAPGTAVLDIGAGSGRDAFALADRGYQVTAVEPSQGMRTWAHAQAASSSVKWIDDALPDLLKVRAEHKRFEFVLCSAVLMHVPPKALARSFRAMAALAMPGGRIAASVRPPLATDPSEIFHAHTRNAVLRATRSAHLNLLDEGETGDKLGRDGVSWRWFVFQTPVPQGS